AYFTKMSEDPLLKAHDLDEMRRDMWRQIKGFYEQLATQQSDDLGVEAERALTLVRLGRMTALLGSRTEAVEAHRQALKIYERLIQERGNLPEYEDGMAQALLELGTIYQLQEDWPAAREALYQALPIREHLERNHPDDFA